jgi:hypothetical protein
MVGVSINRYNLMQSYSFHPLIEYRRMNGLADDALTR